MRIVPFPDHGDAAPDEAWLTELEAALSGTREGPAAESWRELRADVRALARPIAPEFERQLAARISDRGAHRRRLPSIRLPRPTARAVASVAAAASMLVAVIAIAISGFPHDASFPREPSPRPDVAATPSTEALGPSANGAGASAHRHATKSATPALAESGASSKGAASAPAESGQPAAGGPAFAPAREQQLGASVTLAPSSADVQQTADSVSRVVVDDGGYVQSSHVQVQQVGASEASLMLSLPSQKLSAALASIAQIAPVRAQSQSLQDITSSYNAARRRLADANAERQALLRTLSAASGEGQIASLRERLSQSESAITHARAALEAVSHRASNAEVEVTVLGDVRPASEGLTIARALHDAGAVLTAVLAGLLIAGAVIVPLALVLIALASARRAWRRYRREAALDGS
jgi:hypothetical protein